MSRIHAFEDIAAEPILDEWELDALAHPRFDAADPVRRALRDWNAMRRGRPCPSIEDLEPVGVAGPNDVLIDLRSDRDDPHLACIGGALVAECGARGLARLSQVPQGSLLALLAADWREAEAARRPVGFAGERAGPDGQRGRYRAILMPFASDGERVDFVQGRIAWHDGASDNLCAALRHELERARSERPSSAASAAFRLA